MKTLQTVHSQRGALLIEVLITIVVVAIGALGLIQMQTRLQSSEMEAYQRTQAVILLNDMAHRISANRGNAASYVTTTLDTPYLGGTTTDLDCSTISTADLQGSDFAQWCNSLQGAAEIQSGSGVGAMLGGRGCVQAVGASQYMVTVAWQGLTPVSAPPPQVSCGVGLYDVPNLDCGTNGELCRRYVTSLVSLARLDL